MPLHYICVEKPGILFSVTFSLDKLQFKWISNCQDNDFLTLCSRRLHLLLKSTRSACLKNSLLSGKCNNKRVFTNFLSTHCFVFEIYITQSVLLDTFSKSIAIQQIFAPELIHHCEVSYCYRGPLCDSGPITHCACHLG